jgi:hypothetical protein
MIFLLVLTVSICSSFIFKSYPQAKNYNSSIPDYIHSQMIEKNNIKMFFNNLGKSYRPSTQSGGFWEIQGENYSRQIIFDQAPWIVGKRNDEVIMAGSQWFNNYSPGPIINGQAAMLIHPEDSLKYRVYKISKGDSNSNPDYAEWPVNFGAPVTNQGTPLVIGDQTLWTSFNFLDSTLINPFGPFNNISPIEIEIHQTVFSREGSETDYQDIFSNVIFIEYEIIYKGNDPIDSAFFGFWTDIDFDPYWDNRPAVDVPLDLGYCWTNADTTYEGYIPVAVGYSLLYGPIVPEIGSTGVFKGRSINNFKNLTLNAFRGVGDDSIHDSTYAPVRSISDIWNFAHGLNTNGNPYIDPTTNQQTKFPLSGDPVTNSGWLSDPNWVSGGSGVMLFAGPFSLAPNDTQWTVLALVPGLGNSNLNSIEAMRAKVEILKSLPYDSIAFGKTNHFITDVEEKNNSIPEKFFLSQNYPNPFNPSTKISWQSPVSSHHTLKIYDVLGNEVATLVDEYKPAGIYNVQFTMNNLASGIYFYRLKAGSFVQTKKMILIK